MNKITLHNNILYLMVFYFLSISCITIGMHQHHIEIKPHPEATSATYLSPLLRSVFSQQYGFKTKKPSEPFIFCSYSITPFDFEAKSTIDQLKQMGLQQEQIEAVLKQNEKMILIPVTYLLNKKNGDNIAFHCNVRFIYCNTSECEFDKYISGCMKKLQTHAAVDAFPKSELEKLSRIGISLDDQKIKFAQQQAQQEGTISIYPDGSIQHGPNGWNARKSPNRLKLE